MLVNPAALNSQCSPWVPDCTCFLLTGRSVMHSWVRTVPAISARDLLPSLIVTPHLHPQVDMEDLGGPGPRRGAKAKAAAAAGSGQPREMVTPLVRASLTKQGYKVLGSHSGVKMCR
jgi:hypothetical protein